MFKQGIVKRSVDQNRECFDYKSLDLSRNEFGGLRDRTRKTLHHITGVMDSVLTHPIILKIFTYSLHLLRNAGDKPLNPHAI
jgi:hypothetical protein